MKQGLEMIPTYNTMVSQASLLVVRLPNRLSGIKPHSRKALNQNLNNKTL